MPADLKQKIDAAAAAGGRSINSEIVDRLWRSLEASGKHELSDIPDGLLLDEVVKRYGAQLQLTIAEGVAERAGMRKRAK